MFKSEKTNKQSGFFKLVIVLLIAIITLSYFGFDLKTIIESPQTQGNLNYTKGIVTNVWDNYLERPATYLWNDIFMDLLWDSFVDNLQKIKSGSSTNIEEMAPMTLPIE